MNGGYSILGLLLVTALIVIIAVYWVLTAEESREDSVTNSLGAVDQAEQIRFNYSDRHNNLEKEIETVN